METYEAEVTEDEDEDYFLTLNLPDNPLDIPLTQDSPKEVQEVFNQLIVFLKEGLFQFEIEEDDSGDLFYHVSKEYVAQLNSELEDVFNDMEAHGLTSPDED
jgi:hypothetical protein